MNAFAYNQIVGGRLGVHDAQDLAIVGNYIEIGPGVDGTVVRLGGAIERLLFADNSVVRPKNADLGSAVEPHVGADRLCLAGRGPTGHRRRD